MSEGNGGQILDMRVKCPYCSEMAVMDGFRLSETWQSYVVTCQKGDFTAAANYGCMKEFVMDARLICETKSRKIDQQETK